MIILICLILIHCQNTENQTASRIPDLQLDDYPTIELQPVKTITQVKEDDYFTTPSFVKYNKYDDRVYVVDKGNHRIVVFDTELNYITEFGRYGQGDGEFEFPGEVAFFSDGGIAVSDIAHLRIQLFDRGYVFLDKIKFDHYRGRRYNINITSADNIVMNHLYNDTLFVHMTREGKVINRFGDMFSYEPEKYEKYDNDSYAVIDNDDNILVFFINHTVLRKYDLFGSLIIEKDFSDLKITQNVENLWLNHLTNMKNSGKEIVGYHHKNFIEGLSIDSDYLYVQFSGYSGYPVYYLSLDSYEVKKIVDTALSEMIYSAYYFNHTNNIFATSIASGALSKFTKN